ncbi:hypothetical protein BAE44_0011949 [Dichanthelium oligosanthes]|uniref:Uncharacterized protein n=1 Tax=Dichanthelium oligosanthes TaxID=888268 RepID=A0A1E5VPL2_9POAL|nr:hypothetical protein BAE44_0011949 [Dichanthelium oligosanthes]
MASADHLAPVGAEAAQDCVSMLGDAIDLLEQSVEAMKGLVGKERSGGQAAGSNSRNVRFQISSSNIFLELREWSWGEVELLE